VAGESLIDVLVLSDGSVRATLGDAPFNVSLGLTRLEVDAGFFGAVSEDAFGRRLLEALPIDGIEVAEVVPSGLPTTPAVAEPARRALATASTPEGGCRPSLADRRTRIGDEWPGANARDAFSAGYLTCGGGAGGRGGAAVAVRVAAVTGADPPRLHEL
jgi:fructokinase